MIEKEIPDYTERVFYACGPPAMVEAMENLLNDLNVPLMINRGNEKQEEI